MKSAWGQIVYMMPGVRSYTWCNVKWVEHDRGVILHGFVTHTVLLLYYLLTHIVMYLAPFCNMYRFVMLQICKVPLCTPTKIGLNKDIRRRTLIFFKDFILLLLSLWTSDVTCSKCFWILEIQTGILQNRIQSVRMRLRRYWLVRDRDE
jgi:hypothetical protein